MADQIELNGTEKEAFEELKKRLDVDLDSNLKNDKIMFLRFLRARDFNLDLSEEMLRRHLNWRKNLKIDALLTDYTPNEIIVKYLPISRIGFDKDGSPVRYFDFGNMDLKGILKAVRANDVVKSILTFFEDDVRVMREQSLKHNKPVYQWIYVMNFDGYTFGKATHKPSIEFLLNIFQVYEANYPERLKGAFVINTSSYFTMIYSILKPFLSPATVKKVFIYGKDKWKTDLLKQVDADALPAFLGGEKTDPDGNPECRTICKHGEAVPEELYMTRSKNRISSQPGASKLVVSRKSKALLPLEVKEGGSMIEWEFETESRDINFGLCYKVDNTKQAETVDLIQKQRIDAHLVSEAGMYKCEKPGIYILVFDNSYSWIHRKEIYCKASIIEPGEKSS